MARIELAATPEGLVLTETKGTLAAAVGATVHVYQHGTTTPVTVYAAAEGASILSQPLTANSEGLIPGWVEEAQRLDMVVTFKGITSPPREVQAIIANAIVTVAGAQTISGSKAFTASPTVPAATLPEGVARLSDVTAATTSKKPILEGKALSITGTVKKGKTTGFYVDLAEGEEQRLVGFRGKLEDANARTFNGTTDSLVLSPGACKELNGNITFIALVKLHAYSSAEAKFGVIWGSAEAGAKNAGYQFGLNNEGSPLIATESANIQKFAPVTLNDWTLVAFTKATGTTVFKFLAYDFVAQSWKEVESTATLANPTGVATRLSFGTEIGHSSNFLNADIAMAAVWGSVISNAEIKTLVSGNKVTASALKALGGGPAGMWTLNQPSIEEEVKDQTAGAANQTSVSGTTVTLAANVDYGQRATVKILRNGKAVSSLEAELSAEGKVVKLAEPPTLAAGDFISAEVTAITSSPVNLSVTPFLEHLPSPPPSALSYNGFSASKQPDGTWVPYAGASVFNKKVAAEPKVASESAAIVTYLLEHHTSPQPSNMRAFKTYQGTEDFAHPVYWASITDPLVELKFTREAGNPLEGVKVYCPEAARPAGGSDGHMILVQPNGDEIDLYQSHEAKEVGGKLIIESYWGSKTSISGAALGKTTAANFALMAGVIRPEEVLAGKINHALFALAPACTTAETFPGIVKAKFPGSEANYVWPATHGAAPEAGTGRPPTGAHLWLAVTEAEVNAISDPFAKIVARAMMEYGAYIGDTSGGGFGLQFLSQRSYNAFSITSPLYEWAKEHELLHETGEGGNDFYVFRPSLNIPWSTKLRVLEPPSISEPL